MRVLGFSKRWAKLWTPHYFSTFRMPRKDNDWRQGEQVQVVLHPRSKDREVLGTAEIITVERRWVIEAEDSQMTGYADYFNVKVVTEAEAIVDGFQSRAEMVAWVGNTHRLANILKPMNKLVLKWIKSEV